MANNEIQFSVQEIQSLMESFQKNKLGSFSLSQGEFCLKFESRRVEYMAADGPTAVYSIPAPPEHADSPAAQPSGNVVTSPIVGTFYAAPSPEKPPFVQVGQEVKKGDVLFIIESMKLMNEVTSDYDGVVSQVLAENGQGVEFGQPIICIE